MRIAVFSGYRWIAWSSLLVYGVSAYVVSRLGTGRVLDLVREFGSPCPVFLYTGFECGFCGMTRAFVHLFSGDPAAAFRLNALSVPVFIGIPAIAFWWGFRKPGSWRPHPVLLSGFLILLAVYAVARNLMPEVP